MTAFVWFNPRCSKSRGRRELLEERGVQAEYRNSSGCHRLNTGVIGKADLGDRGSRDRRASAGTSERTSERANELL